jgi:hypothetical protein
VVALSSATLASQIPETDALGDEQCQRILRRRGYSVRAATEIVRIGSQLRSQGRALTVRQSREFAAVVDPEGASQWGETVEGAEKDAVAIRALLRTVPAGRQFAALHTHPSNSPPSMEDAGILIASPSLRSVLIAGHDGNWFALTKWERNPELDEFDLRLYFERARLQLEPAYAGLVATGGLTEEAGNQRLLHAIWRILASHFGLRYDWTDAALP